MPGMDGFTAARTIRALPPPRGRVPIVALTADAFQTSRQRARDAGMDGFLTKPAHLPQLREALERYGGVLAPAALAASTKVVVVPAQGAAREIGSLLDDTTVDDMRQTLSAARYAGLLGGFFDTRARTIATLRQAATDAARAELGAAAHSLKGGALSLGLRALGERAGRLQRNAADAPVAELMAAVDQIEQTFDASAAACTERSLLTPPAVPARA